MDNARAPQREPERLRYLDLLRVVAISAVVLGHWLLIAVTYQHGRLSGVDAITRLSWGRWATLVFQVMPVFFLVGGYVSAQSWSRRRAEGLPWSDWLRVRVMVLLWPTAVYIAFAVAVAAVAAAVGATPSTLGRAAWLVALHLWFLPVYLMLIALTPALLAAYERWGLWLLAGMALGAGLADVAILGPHLRFVGFATYLCVWGAMFVGGFAWRAGDLTRDRWRPLALAGAGALALAALVNRGPFPVDMIGTGRHVGNTTPPSVALLAFACVQTGIVVALEPAATAMLRRPQPWGLVARLNPSVMNIYLWHLAPVLVAAALLYPTGVAPQSTVGSAGWFAFRLVWLAALTVVMVPLVAGVNWLERPMRRLPAGLTRTGPRSPVVLAAGVVVTMVAIARFAIRGFAPDGSPAFGVLVLFAAGLLLVLTSGGARDRAIVSGA